MKSHELLADPRRFATGAVARDAKGRSCGVVAEATHFDCLGAFLRCWLDADVRRPVAKRLFSLCYARHGHKRLGRLDYAQALSLLRDVDYEDAAGVTQVGA